MALDTPLHHFCNRDLAIALRQLRDRNVLVMFVDGSVAFGRLGRLDDCLLNILPAVGIPCVNTVRFRPPNPTLPGVDILVSELVVDVCNVAGVVEGPFVFPPISETGKVASIPKAPPPKMKVAKPPMTRQHSELIEELAEFEGQNVGVILVGGWVVGGMVGEVSECVCIFGPGTSSSPLLITLGVVNIFGPPLVGGVQPMVGTFRVWVNLRAMTGLLLP